MWYDRRLFLFLLLPPNFPRAFTFDLMVAHFLASGMEAARHTVEVQLFSVAKNDFCLSKECLLRRISERFQRIPVAAAARPAVRRGPRPAPPRAAVEPENGGQHKQFILPTLFAYSSIHADSSVVFIDFH